jgi:PAS domain S-box-containing protein
VSRARDATFETEVAEKIAPIARSVLDAVIAVDAEGVILTWNELATQTFGWTPEEAVGRNMGALIVPRQFRKAHNEGMRRYQRTGEARVVNRRIEIAAVDKAGREFPIELAIVDMMVSGRPVFLGFLRDISARRAAEARLAQSEDELRRQAQEFHALADNIPTLCWMAYADGHIYWYNRRWYEYTGTSADTQEGWGWESVHHPDHLPGVVERWRSSLETGQPFEMTFPLLGADGDYRPFLTRVVPIRDEAGAIMRWFGANIDVTDQERQQEHLQLMINELNHRVKNTLATVQSIATRSLRNAPTVEEGLDAFEGRLMALSATHDVLTETHWEGADLHVLLGRALKPFASREASRLVAEGSPVWLPQRAAISLAMVLHELATNAVKYGALSTDRGSVTVRWSMDGGAGRLQLEWVERGGPLVQPPTRVGFGSRLIQRTIRSELEGSVELAYAPEGLSCQLSFLLEKPSERQIEWRAKQSGDRLSIAPSR